MGASVSTAGAARRGRLLSWLEKPLAPLQLKQTDMADRPLNAKGGRKVVIQLGDERIEYVGGMTKVEGRIKPEAQDALEPKLEALGKARDEAAAKAIADYAKQVECNKATFAAVMAKSDEIRRDAINSATSIYETAAREAILSASAGGK